MLLRVIAIGVFSLLIGPFASAAAAQDGFGRQDEPYHIKADELSFDDVTHTYRARGNASVVKGNQALYAEAVDFYEQTKEARAWGNVRFFSGADWLTGSQIEINLEEGTGILEQGTLFLERSHFYLRGNHIEKTGKDSYFIKGTGSFTTCDGDSPDWRITGQDVKVTLEGYGSVKHATLRAGALPVLYVPYIVFPAKIKRQTGLLIPLISYSNTSGFSYNQPFFWAISDSSDATFYQNFMDHRGFKHGVEYRYVRSLETKGTVMYDFLYDKQIDDGSTPSDSSGYSYEGFRGDSEDRLNRKRWWFRTKADWELPEQFNARLDVDVVSDQDYLREFDSGYSGYEDTNAYFTREFGRELDDKEDAVRTNQLNVNKTWDRFSFNGSVLWYDDVIVRKNNEEDSTLQSLPALAFSGTKQALGETDFFFGFGSSLTHYWREADSTGYLFDLSPTVYYPIALFQVFDLEPSLGLRETVWQEQRSEPASDTDVDRFGTRELLDLGADLSTEISRIYPLERSGVDKIRHAIRPQVVYTYVPDVDQNALPSFVASTKEQNLLTYSVTNTLTSRRGVKQAQEEESVHPPGGEEAHVVDFESGQAEENRITEDTRPPVYAYHDFCRFDLSQSYNLLTARRAAEGGNERRPFSDVTARLDMTPFYDVALDVVGNAAWSPYSGDFQSYDAAVAFATERKDSVSLEYRYAQDSNETVLGRIFVNLLETLATYWEHEHDLKERQEVRSSVGFRYTPQCWSFGLRYTNDRTSNKREVFFEVGLYGLGKYELGGYQPE